MLFTNLRKRKLFTKYIFSQSLQPFTFQLNKTVCNTKFIVNLTRNDSQKRHILAFFPWACVEISPVSRARRVRKQATIKLSK